MCLKDGQQLTDEVSLAIADFEKKDIKDIFAGIKEIGKVFQELPADLTDCKGMSGDITRIENWAKIFTHPLQLLETVAKNAFSNLNAIKTDVTKLTSDYSSQDYYNVGDDVADILILTLGPVPESEYMPEDIEITQW